MGKITDYYEGLREALGNQYELRLSQVGDVTHEYDLVPMPGDAENDYARNWGDEETRYEFVVRHAISFEVKWSRTDSTRHPWFEHHGTILADYREGTSLAAWVADTELRIRAQEEAQKGAK